MIDLYYYTSPNVRKVLIALEEVGLPYQINWIDITAGEESGAVSFDAVVEIRPQILLEGYGGLKVTVPSPEVSEEDIAGQIDRMRSNFGSLEPVDRPAVAGDNLTIDLKATREGEPVAGLTTDIFLY